MRDANGPGNSAGMDDLRPILESLFERQRQEMSELVKELRLKQDTMLSLMLGEPLMTSDLLEHSLLQSSPEELRSVAPPAASAQRLEEMDKCPVGNEPSDFEMTMKISSPWNTPSQAFKPAETRFENRMGSMLDVERRERAERRAVELEMSRRSRGAVMLSRVSTRSIALANRVRRKIREIVEQPLFELVGLIVVFANSAYLGYVVQYQAEISTSPSVLEIPNLIFVICFWVELFLRYVALGSCRSFLLSAGAGWRLFDTFVVVTSSLDLLLSFTILVSGATSTILGNLRFLRMLRIIRIMRAVRVFKVLNYIRPLRTLLQSIVCTLKSLLWAMLLLAVFVYVFALILTDAVTSARLDPAMGDAAAERGLRFFGNMGRSMLTLYMSITGGLEWAQSAEALAQISIGWTILFCVYVAFCLFAVLNVMTGVFCQSAIENIESDHELTMHRIRQEKSQNVETMQGLVDRLFAGERSQGISLKDCERLIEDEFFHNFLTALSLDVSDAWTLFKLLDQDGDLAIDVDEFVEGCMKLKGPAKALDLAATKNDVRSMKKRVENIEALVESLAARPWLPVRPLILAGAGQGSTPPPAEHLSPVCAELREPLKSDWPSTSARLSRPVRPVQPPED